MCCAKGGRFGGAGRLRVDPSKFAPNRGRNIPVSALHPGNPRASPYLPPLRCIACSSSVPNHLLTPRPPRRNFPPCPLELQTPILHQMVRLFSHPLLRPFLFSLPDTIPHRANLIILRHPPCLRRQRRTSVTSPVRVLRPIRRSRLAVQRQALPISAVRVRVLADHETPLVAPSVTSRHRRILVHH